MESLDPTIQEELIAEWTEPPVAELSSHIGVSRIMAAAIGLAVLMIVIGYFAADSTFYYAAVAAVVGGVSLSFQKKRPQPPLAISLTTMRIQVGQKTYPLQDLAGFWLLKDQGFVVINVEHNKPTLFPITFHFSSSSEEEAHALMTSILPEVEPRSKSLADTFSSFFHL